MANLAMYANTVNANKAKASKDIQAYTNVPLKTLMPNQQLIQYNPYNQMAKETEAGANTLGARQARSTSNANVGNASQLESYLKGQQAASKYRGQGAATTADYLNKQQTADFKTLAGNIGNSDANLAAIRGGQSKALMTKGMLGVANNTALNNLLLAGSKNLGVKEYKRNLGEMYKYESDPKRGEAYDMYTKITDDANAQYGLAKYQADYEKYKTAAGTDKIVPFEESQHYKNYLNAKQQAEANITAANQPLQAAEMRMQYGVPLLYSQQATRLYKAGGSLSKQDIMDIDDNKAEHTRHEKEEEMVFKAILHNNEMLEKALSRVFK